MKLLLREQEIDSEIPCRTISDQDIPALGTLMHEAYRGTIDDEGESVEEATAVVRGTLDGKYGPLIDPCSFLTEENGSMLSACIITWFEGIGGPLLAFSFTHPEAQNRGLAANLIRNSINALLGKGYRELYLVVTAGNHPAEHLYHKLGFEVTDPSK